jgi:predicted  nucleic acid-binding Zn-ribbon protein
MSQHLRSTLIAIAEAEQQSFAFKQQLRRFEKEIADVYELIAPVEEVFLSLQAEKKSLVNQQQQTETELEEQRILIEKLEKHVPKIRNEKEFEASKKQLELSRKHRSQLEETELEIAIKLEDLDPKMIEQESQLKQKRKESKKELDQTITAQNQTVQAIQELEDHFQKFFEKAPKPIQQFYQRCQQNGLHRPITPVFDKTCGGCNIRLQPQFVNEFLTDPDNYRNCPHCNRILYMPLSEEEIAVDA